MAFHKVNNISIIENVFRVGSEAYVDLFSEAKKLYAKGLYELKEGEEEVFSTDICEWALYNGHKIPLDCPMINESYLDETKKKPKLNKPTRNTGGGKKYKVFVRNPKTGGIKKVTFGDKKGGLEGNWNDPKARASFAKRHKCAQKKDKTKAGYWACRAHKYFGKNVPGRFW